MIQPHGPVHKFTAKNSNLRLLFRGGGIKSTSCFVFPDRPKPGAGGVRLSTGPTRTWSRPRSVSETQDNGTLAIPHPPCFSRGGGAIPTNTHNCWLPPQPRQADWLYVPPRTPLVGIFGGPLDLGEIFLEFFKIYSLTTKLKMSPYRQAIGCSRHFLSA